MISIILPVFNGQSFIAKSIESVINQSFKSWELLICDDASTDNTESICRVYEKADERIRYFGTTVNQGVGRARNLGLNNSRYSFIAFLDADDVWDNEKLMIQYQFMLKKECAISFCGYHRINENGERLSSTMIFSSDILTGRDYLKNTGIGMSTSMINTEITKDFWFEEDRIRQDMLLWINLLIERGFTAHGIDLDLVGYRIHGNSISKNKIKAARKVLSIYLTKLDYNFGLKVFFFFCYLFNSIKKRR